MDNKRNLRNLVLGMLILILLVVFGWVMMSGPKEEPPNYADIMQYFEYGSEHFDDIKFYDISLNGKVVIEFTEESKLEKLEYKVPDVNLFINDVRDRQKELREMVDEGEISADYANHPLIKEYDITAATNTAILTSILPTVALIAIMVVLWIVFMRRMNNMAGNDKQLAFGKAKIKDSQDEKRKTTFDDVAGADEEKEELSEIVGFLKDPKKYFDMGAHIPKGVLLVGPPGTGKTLLARAVAGEAGVPFLSISGSDFVEMFVGVGASRVRDLFEQAKKHKAAIVFIDEIDAVGRHRGSGLGGGHDEREQTLNQLLVEMDGFGVNEGVIVIAATNRPDILDPALTRPGRFDRQITVGYPDIKGREAILKVHSKNKPIAPDVDLSVIAKTTAGFTGADLENLLNEAALLAARKDHKAITMAEIEDATIKVVVGTEKKSRVMSENEKHLTAVHEAGHAVATFFCKTQDPVHQISIIPRGRAGGFTMSLPSEDRSYRVKTEILEDIVVLLGGRCAEALVLGDISTGASNDIERATALARDMVTKYGMSEKLGPIVYGQSEGGEIFLGRDMGHIKDYSDEVAHQIDMEVGSIIMSCMDKCKSILSGYRHKLDAVSDYLITNEKMSGEEFDRMMRA